MPSKDILQFNNADMVNLQGWLRKKPKQFTRAAVNVVNSMAFEDRRASIDNVKQGTKTRVPTFVSKSMKVEKAKHGTPLKAILAQSFSTDISGKGRSTGFEELEGGTQYKGTRVPTLMSRGGNQSRKVAPKIRMNKGPRFHKHKQFKGPKARTKHQQVAAMMNASRQRKISNEGMVIPSGLSGKMGRMTPGIYQRKAKNKIMLVNPFKGVRRRTRQIRWAQRAAREVSRDANIRRLWSKEIDFLVRK